MCLHNGAINITLSTSPKKHDTLAVVASSVIEFLTQQFAVDKETISRAKAFSDLSKDADLQSVHDILTSDLCLEHLGLQYDELMQLEDAHVYCTQRTGYSKSLSFFLRGSSC